MSKRYFWLKLQDDFFESKRIKKMRRMAGGDTMLVLYLKMQLIAMQNDGIIEYTGLEDTFAEELALDLDESTDAVAQTLAYLIKTGLCEVDGDNYFFPFAVSNVGSENSSAERVRQYRERQKTQGQTLQCNAQTLQSNVPALQRNVEKDIEIDIEIDIESETPPALAKSKKHKYGEFGHVLLTDEEVEKLRIEHPADIDEAIQYLDEYIEMKGTKYKSHYLAIKKWVFDAVNEHKPKTATISVTASSYDTDSFYAKAVAQSYQ